MSVPIAFFFYIASVLQAASSLFLRAQRQQWQRLHREVLALTSIGVAAALRVILKFLQPPGRVTPLLRG